MASPARPTARAVALACGLDTSTVSRVLNQDFSRHQYAPATVARVEAAARRVGYRPSHTARSLRTGRTLTCALVVPQIANPFFAELAEAFEAESASRGLRILIASTGRSAERQGWLLAELVSRGVDGILLSPTGPKGCREAIRAGVPLATVDQSLPGLRLPHVGLDDRAAGRMLGAHLAGAGYRRVAVSQVGPAADHTFRMRLQGLSDGLGAAAKSLEVFRRAALPLKRQAVLEQFERRLQGRARWPDAVVGLNNVCTGALFEALRRVGADVPAAIGIAGIDDVPNAGLLSPGLTVVAQPIGEIARAAMELLVRQSPDAGREHKSRTLLLPPQLVVRDSLHPTQPPKTP